MQVLTKMPYRRTAHVCARGKTAGTANVFIPWALLNHTTCAANATGSSGAWLAERRGGELLRFYLFGFILKPEVVRSQWMN
jgi:hypothetical protein